MCKLNKYTTIVPGNRVVHHAEHELCSRSRNNKPCDRTQEFRYPTEEHVGTDRLSPRTTYEQFPPTPPRSSRSPSTSDSERPIRRPRSESYYASNGNGGGGRVDVSSHSHNKLPSPRRGGTDHGTYVEATSVPRSSSIMANNRRFVDAPVAMPVHSRRPPSPSPYEEEFETYDPPRGEPASDVKSTTSSTSSKHSASSQHSSSSKHSSSNSSTTSKESKGSVGKHSKGSSSKNYDARGEDEEEQDLRRDARARDPSPQPAARTVKKVLIAEDPSHKKRHRRTSSVASRPSPHDSDNEEDDNGAKGGNGSAKVNYYTPGVQSRINRQNEEIANRPAAPVPAPASAPAPAPKPVSSKPVSNKAVSRPPLSKSASVSTSAAMVPVSSAAAPASSAAARTRYRRGSVQIDDTLALTAKLDDLMIQRQQAEEKQRRRQERDDRAMQARLKERLQRSSNSTYGPGSDAHALVSPRLSRNEPAGGYRY
ncbi:hypothetical protein SLS62_001819 [Diatrype stigma]|uniref:Uncharacterized protein n=1 Tax=Diatrype stigma TaxID=117547 RepID=A0AAN9UZ65_9PEZI